MHERGGSWALVLAMFLVLTTAASFCVCLRTAAYNTPCDLSGYIPVAGHCGQSRPMTLIFAIHFVPNAPQGEWVTGIDVAPRRCFPSHHFRHKGAPLADAKLMNQMLRFNPEIAAHLSAALAASMKN